MKALVFDFLVKQNHSLLKREAINAVDAMRSVDLILWCGRMRLLTPRQYRQLLELNRIRNACAHKWIIDIPKQKKLIAKGISETS